jgi:hypothetical protein
MASNATLDITNIPDMVNTALLGGTNLIAAQILCSAFILMMVTMPMLLTRQKIGVVIVISLLALAGLTAMDWLPAYVYIVVLVVGVGFLARAGADSILG